jgi:hypothetical protein
MIIFLGMVSSSGLCAAGSSKPSATCIFYHGGSPMNSPGPGVVAYCAELEHNYSVIMPEVTT